MSYQGKKRKYKEVLEAGSGLIDFYLQNPCIAAYDLMGVDLAPIQRIVFEDFWFKNYVMAIAGRGFGKSVYTNSLSFMENKGLVYLNEELPPIPSYLKDGEEEIISSAKKIYTSEGFKNIKKLCLEKGIEGKQLTTKKGFVNRGSNHHPLLTLDSECNFIYKRMDEFKPGDRICIQRGQMVFGKNEIPLDDAYLIGLFMANGSRYISIADKRIRKFCMQYCRRHKLKHKKDGVRSLLKVFFRDFSYFFEKYKLDVPSGLVPYSIRTVTKESQIAFLQGFYEVNGTFNDWTGGFFCRSGSKKCLQEIQLMLLNFGIISDLKRAPLAAKKNKIYLLHIVSEDAYKFSELIGSIFERRQKTAVDYFNEIPFRCSGDTIPHIAQMANEVVTYCHDAYKTRHKPFFKANKCGSEFTYEKLHTFLAGCRGMEYAGFSLVKRMSEINKLYNILDQHYYFDTVESIHNWKGDCYDFEMDMDGEPNYFVNGFLNHNTFLLGLLAALGCMLVPGMRVGLISPVFRQCYPIISETYDTFWTSNGLKTTTQNFYDSIEEGITKTQSLESQNTILSKWKNPERACRSIKTTKGFEFGGTVDHRVLVLDDELNLVFKELQDITEDDNIAIKKGFNWFGDDTDIRGFKFKGNSNMGRSIHIPENMTEDLAYLLGLLCGDGFISSRNGNVKGHLIGFCSCDDELLDKYIDIVADIFKCIIPNSGIRTRGGCTRVEVSNRRLWEFLKYSGMSNETASEKKFPSSIKKSNKENIAAFIRGMYATDGSCYVTTKGHLKSCTIEYASVSKQLCKELQAMLLNFGIMSVFNIFSKGGKKTFPGRTKESICKVCYRIRITGTDNLTLFSKYIGLGLKRKQDKLDDYLASLTKIDFNNTIPNTHKSVRRLAFDCRDHNNELDLNHYLCRDKKYNKTNFCVEKIKNVLNIAEENDVLTEDYYKLKKIIDLNLSFVKMLDSDYFFAPTIDVEVENESCYWSNGMISHNSKMIFAEVEKLYAQSSILREAADKPPTRGSDVCYLRFKSAGGKTPSYIEALPLGADGSKIRGSRFYLLLIDEFAQVPDKIISTVLLPMGSASLAPMERVRRLEQKERLIKLGLALETDFEVESVNKMITTSSAFYKFNHMWRRMKDHWVQEDLAKREGVKSQYAVWQVPHWDLPEGFLDVNNVAEAKRTMSSAEFRMEYEAEMVSDSEGFFKASLLEECSINSGFTIELRGDPRAQYIIGVDPNQGGRASCGVVVLRIGSVNKIVSVLELRTQTTQQLTQLIQDLCEKLNVIRVFIDKGGGGKAVCDLLEEGYGGKQPLIDRTNDDHRHLPGAHILELTYFNPAWIADANFTTKAMLEDKKLLFPEPPIGSTLDIEAASYETINTLKSQMLNIIVTQTATGILHFDTPQKDQKKDLYSALLLAAHGAKMVEKELEGDGQPILFNSSGLIRMHGGQGTTFDQVSAKSGSPVGTSIVSAAVLKKKFK